MEQQVGSIELEFVKGYVVHHVLIRNSFLIDQSHRYGRHQAACREQQEVMTRLLELLYVLNIKRNIF